MKKSEKILGRIEKLQGKIREIQLQINEEEKNYRKAINDEKLKTLEEMTIDLKKINPKLKLEDIVQAIKKNDLDISRLLVDEKTKEEKEDGKEKKEQKEEMSE